MLKTGDKAPQFNLQGNNGLETALSDFKGRKVVLYFYPKDDTPGCTTEACGFRDIYDDILDKGAVVIGVSPDNTVSHGKFMDKYSLPFYLLSDPDHQVAQAYGAFGEKNVFGKVGNGIIRSTFIIDEEGTVKRVYPKVKPQGHAEEILALL